VEYPVQGKFESPYPWVCGSVEREIKQKEVEERLPRKLSKK
jgi:hypothetical protein